MATQLDTVSTTEVGDAVGIIPVELTFIRFSRFRLHVVFTSHTVEFSLDKRLLFGIGDITLVHGNANHEIVLVCVFESLCPNRRTTCCQ